MKTWHVVLIALAALGAGVAIDRYLLPAPSGK